MNFELKLVCTPGPEAGPKGSQKRAEAKEGPGVDEAESTEEVAEGGRRIWFHGPSLQVLC